MFVVVVIVAEVVRITTRDKIHEMDVRINRRTIEKVDPWS